VLRVERQALRGWAGRRAGSPRPRRAPPRTAPVTAVSWARGDRLPPLGACPGCWPCPGRRPRTGFATLTWA